MNERHSIVIISLCRIYRGGALFGEGPKVSLIFQPFERSEEKTARFKESAQYESQFDFSSFEKS